MESRFCTRDAGPMIWSRLQTKVVGNDNPVYLSAPYSALSQHNFRICLCCKRTIAKGVGGSGACKHIWGGGVQKVPLFSTSCTEYYSVAQRSERAARACDQPADKGSISALGSQGVAKRNKGSPTADIHRFSNAEWSD